MSLQSPSAGDHSSHLLWGGALLLVAAPSASAALQDPFPAGGLVPMDSAGNSLNLDFELGTLEGWTQTGSAFEGQPIKGDTSEPRCGAPSLHEGEYWVGGYELHGDGRIGTLTSTAFEVTHPWAAFLLGGGRGHDTRVDFILTGQEEPFCTFTGPSHESMQPCVLDLREHVGQFMRIHLVDDNPGGWGHVNFDDLRFYGERPVFPEGRELFSRLDVVRHAGLAPHDAPAAMTLPPGFRVDLVAGEPDLHQPIALTIDGRGRLWVAEAYSYPNKRAQEEAEDRILIFEDTDGDGLHETRKVFAENLNLVSGLAVGYGGVFVGAAPELLFLADSDGDDRVDGDPIVLLDGWGYQDTHETLNAFIWGPDGWLYGCHGVFTHSRVGQPGTPDDERTPLNAGVWRFHPKSQDFEVFAHGSSNPWGVDFDDGGRAFITACVIPHLYLVTQGGRYERQAGRHFNPFIFEDIETIADHRHFLGEAPHGGNGVSESVGGGHAHCGAMIYLGDAFPEEFRGDLLVNNVHGNRVNREVLVPDGSGFIGQHGEDFLLANDRWFRGINLKYGPDGSVYLIDWYDPQACHHRDNEVWNRGNGRLYRIAYGNRPPLVVDLDGADEATLVEACLHANDWFVRTSRRLLAERGISAEGIDRLEAILIGHPDEDRRLRALWCLHAAGALTPSRLLQQLHSPHELIRAWSVQLACEGRNPNAELLGRITVMGAVEESPVVRLYLASALQRLPLVKRWALAQALVSHAGDHDDANIPYLLWYGIEPLVSANPSYAMNLARSCRIPRVSSWIWQRAAAQDATLPALMSAIAQDPSPVRQVGMLDAALRAFDSRSSVAVPAHWPEASTRLFSANDPQVHTRALAVAATFGDAKAFPYLRERLADKSVDLADRIQALDTLVRAKDSGLVPTLLALVADPDLASSALKALAVFDHPGIPPALLAGLAGLAGQVRRDAISTLTARTEWALALLDAMQFGSVPHSDLGAFELRKLRALDDPRVRTRLNEVWGVVRENTASASEQIARLHRLLSDERLEAADRSAGRVVFEQTCMKCHTLYGQGQAIGPDLTGAGRSDVDYLLQNMVDPNAIIPREYQMSVIATVDGRMLNGIVQAEDDESLSLQTENDLLVLALDEIEARKEDLNSMMPEGQLDTLTDEQIANLVAYLRHDSQVPLPD